MSCPRRFRRIRIPPSGVLRETILLRFVHAGFPQQADQLVFVGIPERKASLAEREVPEGRRD